MGLFRRLQKPTPPASHGPGHPPPVAAEPPIRAARTLVKSEPELVELMESEPRLGGEHIDVELSEKGFGTRVVISASRASGLSEAELGQILDRLAEPQKRPFSAS